MISIVVPCYREEVALPIFYNEVSEVCSALEESYELIFVNDGSDDSTLDILKEISRKDQYVRYISFSRNFGKEAAMYAGLKNALGDYVTIMDADMQDPPSLLPEMLKIMKEKEYDSVATRRITRKGEPKLRSFFARQFYRIMNKISDADIVDGARDYRLMNRKMVDAIVLMSEYNRFSKGIFGWIGFRTYWLPYENRERVAGKSKWSFWKLFTYAIEGIFNFSDVPLKLASWSGLTMTGLSVLAMIYIVIRKLFFGNPTAGWASIAVMIFFVAGIQLFCLGIMGQYIAKIYMETKNRPHYIVSDSNIEGCK